MVKDCFWITGIYPACSEATDNVGRNCFNHASKKSKLIWYFVTTLPGETEGNGDKHLSSVFYDTYTAIYNGCIS